ncbi:T9SS type A sorting domain-containing protein [Ignavibacterium sp.]|uniref:T9SS type A sorting domain-containing protein n=1 Tax=Ignavibacterium sp. TaxID=2651167 RepID=UPI00307F2722
MKQYFSILFLLSINFVFPQSVYELNLGAKNNQIILELINQSDRLSVNNIQVTLKNIPNTLYIHSDFKECISLQPLEKKEVVLIFDVNQTISHSDNDSLVLLVVSSEGILFEKTFNFKYKLPEEFALQQNYPNPFNPITRIQYQLPAKTRLSLKVYDILGKEIITLVDEVQDAGFYEIDFNASEFSSGIYFSRLETDSFMKTIKMSLVK